MSKEIKKSIEVQQFKIGRIKYNLPAYVSDGVSKHGLYFNWLFDHWVAGFCAPSPGVDLELHVAVNEPTFNKAIRSLHAKCKELEQIKEQS